MIGPVAIKTRSTETMVTETMATETVAIKTIATEAIATEMIAIERCEAHVLETQAGLVWFGRAIAATPTPRLKWVV